MSELQQHEKITGYRTLTQAEIDFMNEIKAAGEQLAAVIQKAEKIKAENDHLAATGQAPSEEFPRGIDLRFLSIGKTQLQLGLMAVTRAVAQPTSF